MQSKYDDLIETLRISDRDKSKLLWAVNEATKQKVDSTQRRLRVATEHTDAVLTLIGEGGSKTRFAVLVRDLSRWGAAVLHGRYTYPESRCELEIKSLDNAWQTRVGEIRHIRHVQGMIHNLGIRFDKPIDLTDFATLTPDEETMHLQELADDMDEGSTVDVVKQMVHRVLVVDDFASDRKLFSYWLTRAGMEVATANDAESAKERVEEQEFDLLIIDDQLGHDSGTELIGKLRRTQFVGPILAVSADEGEQIQARILGAGANTFLSKPFTYEQLTGKAYELMGVDEHGDASPIYSTLNDDKEMRPLLTAFASKLSAHIKELHSANLKNDYESIDSIARSLKGAGSGYGLAPISEHALGVMHALEDSAADMDAIRQSVNELIAVLNRVKLRA